ncbi:MAG: GAF domain-containing sensor histidine kinase [Anaerolineae bacterium]|nr:GAF domain-containing sensor histidine kinase [Anaerolineae bacterium]
MYKTRLDEQDRDQLLSTARRLLVEAEALSARVSAVNEIGIAILRTHDLQNILEVVARQAKWLLDYEHLSVCVRQVDGSWKLWTLFGEKIETNSESLAASTDIGAVLRSGQARLVREKNYYATLRDYATSIIIPLTSDNEILGSINFARRATDEYNQEDMRVGYLLALQLAAAIRNAQQFEELQRAKEHLAQYADELEATNDELNAFSHTIAHDLKTPIAAILVKLYLLGQAQTSAAPKAQSYITDIKASANSMTRMIDQLLWLAKLRNAADTAEVVTPKPIVERALERHKETIATQQIHVEELTELPDVLGHAQWLEEVFANLIGNAIKYMGADNPSPWISITGSREGSYVKFAIKDSGVGVAPEDQTRLFKMFERLHTTKAEGVGLGLSIVHRIVTRLNGQVGIESELGAGSTFWFKLPAPEHVIRVQEQAAGIQSGE